MPATPSLHGKSKTYIAFLHGINVGGRTVPMAALKKTFEKMGYGNVRTVLTSGNVSFDNKNGLAVSPKGIGTALAKAFGFEIEVLLRTRVELEKLVKADPFKGVRMTPETRAYVTFLAGKPKTGLKVPYAAPDFPFKILKVTAGEVLSVVVLSPKGGTTEAMGILEKAFGKNLTTRNWNTVKKLL
ncbi:MAG TPA: DUF1697 domain-containing protein [Gammaproteobacteria bacterium]|nr:DUF1697 domain-containing protein [Gammaproteobacteria bacterium]